MKGELQTKKTSVVLTEQKKQILKELQKYIGVIKMNIHLSYSTNFRGKSKAFEKLN